MKESGITRLLAILTGSSGSSMHYSGRPQTGWIILIACWFVLPAISWYLTSLAGLNRFMTHTLAGSLIILVHISLAIYHSMRPASNNAEAYKNRTANTSISILLMLVGIYAYATFIIPEKIIDTQNSEPSYTMNSIDFSEAYNQNEVEFRKKYDRKVILLSGKVASMGFDFDTGEYVALEAAPGSPTDVNCYLQSELQESIHQIETGDNIQIKGVADGRYLKNCVLIKINDED